jgi:uncharacterized LabA/DUF88 family protein
MMFVDGENLSIRYKNRRDRGCDKQDIEYEPDVFVWSLQVGLTHTNRLHVVRRYYYTSAIGSPELLDSYAERLKTVGIESPHIFPRTKGRASKRVDISLTTDMLTHAHRQNYDLAILVAGDEDYVPLVEAVKGEGRRVAVWFFPDDGLSRALRMAADHFFDVSELLCAPDPAYVVWLDSV